MSTSSGILGRTRRELAPDRLLPGLIAGLLASVMTVTIVISLTALIFSGDLAPYLPNGLSSMLTATVVLAVVVALVGSLPFAIAKPQENPSVILALATTSIASALISQGRLSQVYPTVLAYIILSSVLMGLVYLGLGTFRLGRLIRFIPYPVAGGFLAGTGWLVAMEALGIMVNVPTTPEHLPELFVADTLSHWLPGVALGVLLAVLTARYKHFLVVPATLVVSIAGFYAVLWLTGTSLAQASAHDWLLGPFSQGYRWPPLAPSQIPEINWAVLGQEMGLMLSLLLVGTISLLLNETGLELALHRDTSLDQDLRAHGWANLLSGLLGGAPGYTSLSISLIGPRMRVGRRVVPLVVAFMAGATLLVGANSLSYLPRFTLAGLAFFLGLSLLIEWVYSTWFSLPRLDWVLLMLILAVIITSGLLVGIGVGLIVAMVLFIVRYSRVGVVKNTLDGQSFVSNRQRLLRHERLLREHGASLYILRLQNYLFFGTADGLVTQIRHRVDDTGQPPVKFVVLDFQRVVGMDSSAVLGFVRLQQITSERGIFLVLTHIEDALLRELKLGGQILEGEDVRIFPDLDRGVEWCENQTLAALGEADAREFTFADELAQYLPATIAPPRLLAYMERREVAASETIMRQGEAADKLYLIGAGQATVLLRLPDGNEIRLWTMEPGTWVGEMGFYLGRLRSASVVADEPVTVYSLSRAGLERMQAEDADLAMAFHEMLARVLAERLANTDRMMVGLLA